MDETPRTVLFDLDGTLLDTAPDLAWALNETRSRHGLPTLPYDTIRAVVSHGSFAMTRLGCPAHERSAAFEAFRLELLDIYADNVARHSALFGGMADLLALLERHAITWGIVTNKPARFTQPLLREIALATRPAVVVSGDTTARAKPHPDPLLHAARRLGVSPDRCVYVGDAERDIVAGRAAGMRTLVATYGYLAATDEPAAWGADGLVAAPHEIASWLAIA